MALTLKIKVMPNSGKTGWQQDKNGILKCFLKSLPEKGAANKELIKNLAKILKLPQNDIEILTGLTSRNKTLKIHTDLTLEQFFKKVGIEYSQVSLF